LNFKISKKKPNKPSLQGPFWFSTKKLKAVVMQTAFRM
jgi:hypothetical protein